MLVFCRHRLVVLAVPKTGTTALEAALAPVADAAILAPPGLKHCSLRRYRRELRPFFEKNAPKPFETAAAIRHPRDWLASWFRYRGRDALAGHENSTRGLDFETFVAAHLDPNPPAFARVGAQARMLSGGVDHLFRHEGGGLPRFLEGRLGRAIALERANVSPHREAALPATLAARLEAARADDFALWEAATA